MIKKLILLSCVSDVIKKLVLHPLGFASCGNDGVVKVPCASSQYRRMNRKERKKERKNERKKEE